MHLNEVLKEFAPAMAAIEKTTVVETFFAQLVSLEGAISEVYSVQGRLEEYSRDQVEFSIRCSCGSDELLETEELKQYYQQVAEQGNALWRGIALTRDDCLRRDVIKALICHFRLDFAAVEAQWDLTFDSYFADDMKLLAPLAKDGLVDVSESAIEVTPKGRLLIRNICMCFDAYLRQKARLQQFSRVI